MGDLNRDGVLELACSNSSTGSSNLSVFLASGPRTFAARAVLAAQNPTACACADMDGDGRVDLVNTNWAFPSYLTVQYQEASQGFTPRDPLPVGDFPTAVTT